MRSCTPRRRSRFKGARTTVSRDACRRSKNWHYLRRGGRTRTSAWWRAWVAKLLGEPNAAPPEPVAPLPVSSDLDQPNNTLTITFDAPLDPASTVVASQFRYGNGQDMTPAFGTVLIDGATVSLAIIAPAQVPLGSGAWLFAGAGQLLGANGAVVQPFGPV